MQQKLFVVDDFYQDPDKLRQQILAQPFEAREPTAYHSGQNTRHPVMIKGSNDVFSWLAREPLQGLSDHNHGKWRLALKGDSRKGDIHVDPGTWSGIVYLTPDEHVPVGQGTEFFRHRETGSTEAPLTDQEARDRFGLESCEAVLESIIQKDGTDRSKWDMIQCIPMKYNRLVMFRPWLWHAASEDFGDSSENGRLIQLLFFMGATEGPKTVAVPGGK